MEQTHPKNHKFSLTNRNSMIITGVADVISFDLNEVIVETVCGMMNIKGSDLKVKKVRLEEGEVEVEGSADSIVYSEVAAFRKKGKTLLKRLFS